MAAVPGSDERLGEPPERRFEDYDREIDQWMEIERRYREKHQ